MSGFLGISPTAPASYTKGMADARQALGRRAEDVAAAWLARSGFSVIARNVRLPEGEIDLVCRDGRVWVFVEVKCRHARWGEAPGAAVSFAKRRRLVRLAQHYLKWKGLEDVPCRFDVVAVTIGDDAAATVRHLPAAFDAS
jgi:putative endonuclease